jgi:hypothetical protein
MPRAGAVSPQAPVRPPTTAAAPTATRTAPMVPAQPAAAQALRRVRQPASVLTERPCLAASAARQTRLSRARAPVDVRTATAMVAGVAARPAAAPAHSLALHPASARTVRPFRTASAVLLRRRNLALITRDAAIAPTSADGGPARLAVVRVHRLGVFRVNVRTEQPWLTAIAAAQQPHSPVPAHLAHHLLSRSQAWSIRTRTTGTAARAGSVLGPLLLEMDTRPGAVRRTLRTRSVLLVAGCPMLNARLPFRKSAAGNRT